MTQEGPNRPASAHKQFRFTKLGMIEFVQGTLAIYV